MDVKYRSNEAHSFQNLNERLNHHNSFGIFWNPKEFASFLVNPWNGTGRYFALVESGRPWKLVDRQERKIVWQHGILVLILIFPPSLNHCQKELITWWLLICVDLMTRCVCWTINREICAAQDRLTSWLPTHVCWTYFQGCSIVINIDHKMRRSSIQNFKISIWCSSWWEEVRWINTRIPRKPSWILDAILYPWTSILPECVTRHGLLLSMASHVYIYIYMVVCVHCSWHLLQSWQFLRLHHHDWVTFAHIATSLDNHYIC